jgi:hypothetical protein
MCNSHSSSAILAVACCDHFVQQPQAADATKSLPTASQSKSAAATSSASQSTTVRAARKAKDDPIFDKLEKHTAACKADPGSIDLTAEHLEAADPRVGANLDDDIKDGQAATEKLATLKQRLAANRKTMAENWMTPDMHEFMLRKLSDDEREIKAYEKELADFDFDKRKKQITEIYDAVSTREA